MSKQSRSTYPIDPTKAIYLKPGQRRLPGETLIREKSQWVPHKGDAALDEWGVAVRLLKKQGKL